jgi:hypothetical protein
MSMEDYMKLFFQGEALQQMIACFCNALQRRVSTCHPNIFMSSVGTDCKQVQQVSISTSSISKVLSCMIRSSVCMRLTPVGLAPFALDITLVFPYTHMTQLQINFLHDILHRATFNSMPNTADTVKALSYNNEIVIITHLSKHCIWNGSCMQHHALEHTFMHPMQMNSTQSTVHAHEPAHEPMHESNRLNTSDRRNKRQKTTQQTKQPLNRKTSLLPAVAYEQNHIEKTQKMQLAQETNTLLFGNSNSSIQGPMQPSSTAGCSLYHLDTVNVLNGFCACVFRSKIHKQNTIREGICNVILQMVIGEVGITKDTLQSVSKFIQAAKEVSSSS